MLLYELWKNTVAAMNRSREAAKETQSSSGSMTMPKRMMLPTTKVHISRISHARRKQTFPFHLIKHVGAQNANRALVTQRKGEGTQHAYLFRTYNHAVRSERDNTELNREG